MLISFTLSNVTSYTVHDLNASVSRTGFHTIEEPIGVECDVSRTICVHGAERRCFFSFDAIGIPGPGLST